MKFDQQAALNYIQQIEEKAGEILTDRQEIIALDKRRNDDRVGMRALEKESCRKSWITVGPLLLKMPSKSAKELLIKGKCINFLYPNISRKSITITVFITLQIKKNVALKLTN